MTTAEIWLPCVGFEGYEVSSLGRVRSVDRLDCNGRLRRGRTLKAAPNCDGYPKVTLYRGAARFTRLVHQLVARAFLGLAPRYIGKDGRRRRMECRHLDGDPGNPCVSNLAWGTKVENQADSTAHGTFPRGNRHYSRTEPHRLVRGENHGNAKLTDAKVHFFKTFAGLFPDDTWAGLLGVHKATVNKIRRGVAWRHVQPVSPIQGVHP